MFQIANAYAQSLDGNIQSYFKPISQTSLQGKTTENYVNNIFKKIIFKNDLPNVTRYSEPNWSYNHKKFDWKKSIEFYGYYQSSKNFLSYSNEIKDLFSPDDESIKYITEKYPKIKDNNTLSIHVRLGDYKNFPNIHPTVSVSYLKESLRHVPKSSYIFVFSDDKNWVYNNLKFDNIIFVNEEDYMELWMMSMCQNNILSNSSFSWWGGFLNKNNSKKVFVPSVWFGPNGPNNYIDIYESYHTIIKVNVIGNSLEYDT